MNRNTENRDKIFEVALFCLFSQYFELFRNTSSYLSFLIAFRLNFEEKWPRGYGYLVDQLRRAMASVVLTLAEGNAKQSSYTERRRFFEMSMGSIAEVAACLDLARAFGLIGTSELASFKSDLKLAYVRIKALP